MQKANAAIDPRSAGQLAPGLLRRLAAIIYDTLLLLAVLFLATAIAIPLNAGRAFTPDQYLFSLYLIVVSFLFFGWFWTHGGQTLGMKAWKIRVLSINGSPVNWRQAAVRFSVAIVSWLVLGLGFVWSLVDRNRQTWHDRLSNTCLMQGSGEKDGSSK